MISLHALKELEKKYPVLDLMETAGRGVFEILNEQFNLELYEVVIFCGQGNNAGDGFVLARYLAKYCPVKIIFLGSIEKLTDASKTNYEKIQSIKNVTFLPEWKNTKFRGNHYILVDALLGTGFNGELREGYADAITLFNESDGFKLSIDIPSGVDAEEGIVAMPYVEPDFIATMHDLKPGLQNFLSITEIVDLGIGK